MFHVLGMFQQTVFSFYLAYWALSWAHNFTHAKLPLWPSFTQSLQLEVGTWTNLCHIRVSPKNQGPTYFINDPRLQHEMSVSFLQPKRLISDLCWQQLRKVPIGAMTKCSHGALFFFIHVVWIRPACYTSLLDVIRSRCKMFALRWFHPFSSQRTAWWCLQALGAWMTLVHLGSLQKSKNKCAALEGSASV